jgi:hypothetical protein
VGLRPVSPQRITRTHQARIKIRYGGMLKRFKWFLNRMNFRVGASKYLIDMLSPPESKWSRKDPRSIPKVFLIDAYEVS